jgi:hypothetical protein
MNVNTQKYIKERVPLYSVQSNMEPAQKRYIHTLNYIIQ